ncbi:hypothetical protein RF11_15775 [Thelohanellus kitauei]|uniref:Uncharacterized protein n=1 Tax=Thelohanellus kitauei TaxID=669202 RepID=A0A0C2MWQ4_THEKT|nr:hypothetical protein RF11_15775 [Thelohanellus kitauei]
MDVHTSLKVEKYFTYYISQHQTKVITKRPTFIPTDDSLIFLHDDETSCIMIQLFYGINQIGFDLMALFSLYNHETRLRISNNTHSKINLINKIIPISYSPSTIELFFNLSLHSARWIKEVRNYSENTDEIFERTYEEKCIQAYLEKSKQNMDVTEPNVNLFIHQNHLQEMSQTQVFNKWTKITTISIWVVILLLIVYICAKKYKVNKEITKEQIPKFTINVISISD